MITWKDKNTFIDGGRIFEVTKKNDDGTMESKLIGFEDKSLESLYNETSASPLETVTLEAEPLVEEAKGVEPKKDDKKDKEGFICQYCGRDCKARIGLVNHELACPENPDNRKEK